MNPCDQLFAADRTKRLAEFLWPRMDHFTERFHNQYIGVPLGTCQVCGSPLKLAVRAMRWDEKAKAMECIEAPVGSTEMLKYTSMSKEDRKKLEAKGWLFCEQAACPSLDEEVWGDALRINRARFAKMRDSMNAEAPKPQNKLRS